MRSYQHPAFTVLDKYDILYFGNKSDAGVGSGRRCRFLYWNGFVLQNVKRVPSLLYNGYKGLFPWG